MGWKLNRYVFLLVVLIFSVSCGNQFRSANTKPPVIPVVQDPSVVVPVPTPENQDLEEDKVVNEAELGATQLLWEKVSSANKTWSDHTFKVVEKETRVLLSGADDVEKFCSNYEKLSITKQIIFWGYLISAMVKYESNFKTTARLKETGLGTDSVTGLPVYSEGLLQLSYQDIKPYPFCEFDWNKDKNLTGTDPKKTVFDPLKNLRCGVKILDAVIQKQKRITTKTGAYWAVLIEGGKFQKIKEISELTQSLPFCKVTARPL